MAETPPTDVLVAGYQDIDHATKDFEALVALVKAKDVSIDGVILVTHAQDGSVSVRQTGDNLGRKGAGWGGGVGVAVGLFAPPLLASVAVGAVAGGVVGKFVDHRVEQRDSRQDRREPAARVGRDHRGLRRRRSDSPSSRRSAGAQLRSVVQSDKQGISALKESLAEAMGKFSPDRTVLPIPGSELRGHGRAHDRRVGRRLDDQHDAVAAGGGAERVGRADRRRGLRQPVDVRRARLDAGDDAGRRAGPHVQRLPRDRALLADPGRPADRQKPPHRRLRVDRGAARPVSRATRRACRRTAPRSSGPCRATATRPPGSASGT